MPNNHKVYIPKPHESMIAIKLTPYFLKAKKPKSLHSVTDILKKKKKNNLGQGMTEYLIIVALIAVGSIAIMRTLGGSLRTGFAKITMGIQGKGNPSTIRDPKLNKSQYKRNDMSDFTNGAIE
ncbi:MAG TPA: hypothetical protein PKC21_00385 [Oligoflexia bacterium]|nr:hypothetical protein [Oligoflexia bacterium]HMR23784.1 hypothetical protein [Oligoflexia bacterium]